MILFIILLNYCIGYFLDFYRQHVAVFQGSIKMVISILNKKVSTKIRSSILSEFKAILRRLRL